MHSKITESTQKAALEFSKEYLSIFKNSKGSEILPVIRTQDNKGLNDARRLQKN